MDENKTSTQEQPLLFKKYNILNKIDEGSFGSIYLAENIYTKEKVAIKVENRKQYKPLLEREAYILFYLRGPGLPQIKTFGKTREYFILIQTLLGPSLSSLLDNYYIRFSVKDICMLSIQMLERLEYIHSKDYIHRDIKPHNFLMGLKDPNMLYIIDFGLSKKYRSKKGKHIKFSITNNITGTPRYCSINALRGAEQSRKDDLESLFYVILYFFRGSVPWQNLKIKSRVERFNVINDIKKKINYKVLCQNLPDKLYDFGMYVKNLKFEEDPNYKYMQKLFYSILADICEENDDKFSWIKESNISLSHKNFLKEKPSSHKRLFEKISNSLEKKFTSGKKNLYNSSQTQTNSLKDNITLVSLNIENNLNNNINQKIKKSSSYAGVTDIRVVKLMNTNEINKNNMKKDFYIKNKNYNYNLNIKRNPTAIKIGKISKVLIGDNIKKDYNFSINDNEPIKNIFLRNNKIMYTTPNLLLSMKKNENKKNNSNSSNSLNNQDNYKIINRNNINKIYFSNNKTEIYKNNNKVLNPKNLNYKNILKIKYNSTNDSNSRKKNIIKSNIKYKTSSNMTFNSNNSNNNYVCTYNGENINFNLDRPFKNNRTNTTYNFPLSNGYTQEKNMYNINMTNDSIINKRKSINRIRELRNKRNINLNIKLINNNNYNNVPLMIYNNQSNKLNCVNYSIEKNNSKTKCKSKINKVSNNINNNLTNKQKPINSNRVIKYKVRRKTIESGYDNKNDTDIYKIDEDVHNKIKVMNISNHKTNLDRNTSLYH